MAKMGLASPLLFVKYGNFCSKNLAKYAKKVDEKLAKIGRFGQLFWTRVKA